MESASRCRSWVFPCLAAVLAVGLALPTAAFASPPSDDAFDRGPLRAAGPGRLLEDFESGAAMELLPLDEGLAAALLATGNEETVRVEEWPVAPDRREAVLLTRREIYAPGARIVQVGGGRRELPRSRLVFFFGEAELDAETRVMVAVDPQTGTLEGLAETREERHELRPEPAEGDRRLYRLAPPQVFLSPAEEAAAEAPEFSCGAEDAPQAMPLTFESAASTAVFEEAITSLHTATVGVDTDYELIANKFGGNTAAVTNYLASLFAQMNVMYERDLNVRLLQGTTFLRTTPNDPWTGGSGGADIAKLDEFRNYWIANYGAVPRAIAALISGKQTSGASGIAYVNALCNSTYGYSFTQVFGSTSLLAHDTRIVGHEIGHNFGSRHTHCYLTPTPIDTCFNGESGCYSGAASCPAPATYQGVPNVRGTVMSYCHNLGGCSASSVFHSRTVQLLEPIVESKATGPGACIFPAVVNPTIGSVAPQSGSTGGGTAIAITGTGFLAGATVTLGGVPATSVVVVDSTRITAVTGAHATGAVNLVVTNPGGGSATLANAFFYTPPPAPTGFYTVALCRAVDTRNPNGPLGGPALAANGLRTFDLTGPCGVPSGAKAISVNLTVVGPGATGSLSIYPGNAFPMNATAISFKPGETRSNNAVLTLATNGAGTIGVQNASGGSTHFIIDVNGYFQ
jgi:Metallo-peptidase family M12/IPT/TIG domain